MKTYLTKNKKMKLATMLLFKTLIVIINVASAIILSMQLDAVTQSVESASYDALIHSTAICIIYAAVAGVVSFFNRRGKGAYTKAVMLDVRQGMFKGLMRKSISESRKQNSAEDLTSITQNLQTFKTDYLETLMDIYETAVTIAAAAVLLIRMNPIIAGIAIVTMAIPALLPALFQGALGKRQMEIMENTATYTARVKDFLSGFEILKSFHAESKAVNEHSKSAYELEDSNKKMEYTMAGLYGLSNLLSISAQFLLMFMAGVFAMRGYITVGGVIAVIQLTGNVITPAFELSEKIAKLQGVKPICEQILNTAAITEESAELSEMKDEILVEDLSFAYGDKNVLDDVNARFESGKKYAVVGESGCGKSTLLRLIAGYYDGYKGHIFVDGKEDITCDASLIHQDIFLFDDTVRNNITLGSDVSDKELKEAVKQACLEDVIEKLPEGLDTQVEENGKRLSGGERQRIAIARAILHKKNLLLVDEATSALDAANAAKVEENLLLLPDTTCIVVSHRINEESIKKYDGVLELPSHKRAA